MCDTGPVHAKSDLLDTALLPLANGVDIICISTARSRQLVSINPVDFKAELKGGPHVSSYCHLLCHTVRC